MDLEEARAKLEATPYWRLLGIRLFSRSEGRARVALAARDELRQNAGLMHGGVICSMADSAMAAATLPELEEGQRCVTSELKVNFLRPVLRGEVFAEASLVHRGRRLWVYEFDIMDEEGRLAAKGIGTYMIIQPDSKSASN